MGRRNTRYPHAFSKGKGVPLTSDDNRLPIKGPANGVVRVGQDRSRILGVSPTVANLYKGHWGIAVACASCHNAKFFLPNGLRTRFRQHWGLTLLELERLCHCQCGAHNARCYPWDPAYASTAHLEPPPPADVMG
jgi:hypothetical protein